MFFQVQNESNSSRSKLLISNQQNEVQELNIKIKEYDNIINELTTEITQLRTQIANKDKFLNEVTEENGNLHLQIKNLKDENNNKVDEVKMLMEQTLLENNNYAEKNEFLKASFIKLEEENLKLAEELNDMQQDLENSVQEQQSIHNKYSKIKLRHLRTNIEKQKLQANYEKSLSNLMNEIEELRFVFIFIEILCVY